MGRIDLDLEPSLPPSRIILVRHGQTQLEPDDALRGRLEIPLDAIGREQVRQLAHDIAAVNPEMVVCGPLKRALQTAGAIVELTAAPLIIDPRLIDRDFGEATSMTPEQVEKMWGAIEYAPRVEPMPNLRSRALAALVQDRGTSPVVMVGHDVVNRMILHEISQLPWEEVHQSTACWNIIDWDYETGWRVTAIDQHGPIDPYL